MIPGLLVWAALHKARIVAPAVPQPAAAQAQATGRVTNVYADTDIRAVLAEIGSLSGVTVVPDSSVQSQNISIEFKDEPIEDAVRRVAEFGGYYVKRKGQTFLVSAAGPDSPLFPEFAVFRRYIAQNTPVESLQVLLPAKYKDYVQADKATNLFTILAPQELADQILANLRALDAPVRQVVVEALVSEVTAEAGDEFGFSWNWKHFGVSADQTLSYSKADLGDIAKLKALITSGRAVVRANPRISAMEGRESVLNVGQELYVSLLTGSVAFPISQIQQIRTGVTLRFTALVGDDGTITLKLDPEVGDAITVTPQGNPQTTVRRASTTVRVKPGETIVIGGLVQEFEKKSKSKVPLLGDLPLIGTAFQKTSTSKRRTELILMITPRLSEDGAAAAPGK